MATIDGVWTKDLVWHRDARGRLTEILRSDDSNFPGFGQVYVTVTNPGVVKAWHLHKKQRDTFTCISGQLIVALYDQREDSPTAGALTEFHLSAQNPMLISIPPGVYHGWKCVSTDEALVINIPDRPYDHHNPDEYRLPPDTEDIPYKWDLTPGLVHG